VSPKQAQLMYQGKGKDTSFIPPEGDGLLRLSTAFSATLMGRFARISIWPLGQLEKPNLHRKELHTNVYCLKRRPKASKSIKNDFAFAFDSFEKFFEKCHFECVV
jgi:hypothetical protein